LTRDVVKTVLVCVLAMILGGVVAFFTAGPALFADGALSERVLALGLSVVAYAVVGLILGALVPTVWRLVSIYAWAPLIWVLWLFGRDALAPSGFTLLVLGFALGDAAAVLAGALLGSRLRTRQGRAATT
jgi:hypothetical protein